MTKKSLQSELSYEQYVAWCRMSVPVLPGNAKPEDRQIETHDTCADCADKPDSGPVTVRSSRDGGIIVTPSNRG